MPGENVKLILEKLDELIRAAGGLGEQAWPLLVHQQLIYGYTALCVLMVSILTSLLSRKKLKESLNVDEVNAGAIICIVAIIFGIISLIVLLLAGIGNILNPEYHAIKELMSLINPYH